jgi:WD40 repeat protein
VSSNFLICCSDSINQNGEVSVSITTHHQLFTLTLFQIQKWDIVTGQLLFHKTDKESASTCLKTSPCGSTFATGGATRKVSLYDVHSCDIVQQFQTLLPKGKDINMVSFSPCGRYLQVAGEDNKVIVYDVRFPTTPVHILSHDCRSFLIFSLFWFNQ